MALSNLTKNELIELIDRNQKEIAEYKESLAILERCKCYEKGATEMKLAHNSFVEAGFTNEQAFELLKEVFRTCKI